MFWPILVSSATFWGIALAGALVLGRRYVRALEARVANDEELAELRSRVDALEVAAGHRVGIAAPRASELPRKVPRHPRTLE